MSNLDLGQFIGTTAYHRLNPFTDIVATDGVAYFCKELQAFWVFDDIALETKILKAEPFITVKVTSKDGEADMVFTDGNYTVLKKKHYNFTDLQEGEYEFFVQDKVVMLPTEY